MFECEFHSISSFLHLNLLGLSFCLLRRLYPMKFACQPWPVAKKSIQSIDMIVNAHILEERRREQKFDSFERNVHAAV